MLELKALAFFVAKNLLSAISFAFQYMKEKQKDVATIRAINTIYTK